ncbi:aquaporin-7-like isoform X3 [Argiope bruennichi]|nr:aquaporin-7-like isoform X3 [Argiope bruennichi]XP_055930061.1 aquaporin-7-like isoform X3 [Argiope bruennichi]
MEPPGIEELDFERGSTELMIEENAVDTRVKKFKEKLNTMKCKSDVLRESIAEFLGTFILLLLGNAVIAVIVFSEVKNVGSIIAPIGWGLSLMVAISVTGGVSGCHANPAVTLAFATVGKCSWKKVLPFFFAQYAGAFVASIVLYAIYFESFTHFDGGSREIPPHAAATAQIFATYLPEHISIWTAVGDQIVGTMMLMVAIGAVTDPNNMAVPKGSYPLMIGLSLAAIIFAFPLNCGAPLNPARDLAPRVFTAFAGWGNGVFSFRDYNYFWVPVVGPHIGAIIGVWVYKLMVELHWPVDSYDFANPTEVKTNGEFKKKEDLPFVDKKRMLAAEGRKVEE